MFLDVRILNKLDSSSMTQVFFFPEEASVGTCLQVICMRLDDLFERYEAGQLVS